MSARFIPEMSGDRKELYIEGPANFALTLTINNDDVDRLRVACDTSLLLMLLEEHWPRPIPPIPRGVCPVA